MKKGKVVITYGTFDLFHIGHLNLLKRAKALGDYLIVGVSTDEFNEIKGKKSVYPYEHRAEIVRSIKYVDLVIPERNWEQKVEDIKKYNVDVFVMGDDWKGKFDYLKEYCEVVYLPRTQGISTTELKDALLRLSSILEEDIIKVLEIIAKGRNGLIEILKD
ncbi:glycerol-3-phosphate cytidylyltransferase [Aquifex pyrophilus]